MKANTQDCCRFGSDVGKQCLESVEALASHCLHQDGSMQVHRTAASMQHFLKASYTRSSTHTHVLLIIFSVHTSQGIFSNVSAASTALFSEVGTNDR